MNIKTVVLLFSSCLAASLHGRAEGRVIINEIQTANIDQYVDPSWNYGGWVELYNPHATPFRLRRYWISDDPNNLKKHHITEQVVVYGYSYRNIWFDHHDKYCPSQVNTTLNLEGGTFYLSDENGTLVASQEYPAIPCRASWARTPNLTGEWAYCNHPTPESANAVFTPCLSRMEAPIVDCESGIFEKPFVVHVDIPEGAILRYTQDGSTPTMQNGSTSEDGAFAVDDNTCRQQQPNNPRHGEVVHPAVGIIRLQRRSARHGSKCHLVQIVAQNAANQQRSRNEQQIPPARKRGALPPPQLQRGEQAEQRR